MLARPALFFCLTGLFTSLHAQHDPGRNAVREVAKGKYEAAAAQLDKKPKASPIDAAERHAVQALMASLQDDGATALSEAQLAVEAGAQFGRFVAGPRDAFAALYEAPGYAEWAESHGTELVHGPLVGAVTDTSAKVWLRTAGKQPVDVVLLTDSKEQRQTATPTAETDYTVELVFDNLQPSAAYQISVEIAEKKVAEGAFRTRQSPNDPGRLSIVLGGGAGFTPQYEKMWATIENQQPDALFLLGDNVYIDDPEHQLTNDYIYYRRQSQPEWRSLVSKTPTYAIYDDHDFGMNDCVPGPFIDKPAWKRPVWQTFRNNWANPYYGGGDEQPGCYFDTYLGDVHFIVLDGRFYRDKAGGTMIGPAQKEWLLKVLSQSKGRFKVLASSVPWSPGVKPGSKDTWDGFKEEREEIFSYIESQKIDGVVLLSADRHRVDIRKIKRPEGYDFVEIMSSRLTNVHTHGLVEDAKGSEFVYGYNKTPAFAKITFDTAAKTAAIHCEIIDIEGKTHYEYQVDAAQLRHQKP